MPHLAQVERQAGYEAKGRVFSVGWPHPDAVASVRADWAGRVAPVGSVLPLTLEEALWDLRVLETDFQASDLLQFLPRLAEIDLDRDSRVAALAAILADAATLHAAATHLAEKSDWDVLLVRYDALACAAKHLTGPLFAPCRSVLLQYLDLFLWRLGQFGELIFVEGGEPEIRRRETKISLGPFVLHEVSNKQGWQEFRVEREAKGIGTVSFGRTATNIRKFRLRIHQEWRRRGWGRELFEQVKRLAYGNPIEAECYQDEGMSEFLERCGFRRQHVWHRQECSVAKLHQSWSETVASWGDVGLEIEKLRNEDRAAVSAFLLETVPIHSRLPELELRRWVARETTTGMIAKREGAVAGVCLYRISGSIGTLQMLSIREGKWASLALGLLTQRCLEDAMQRKVSTFHYEFHAENQRVKQILRRLPAVEMRVREVWSYDAVRPV